MPRRKSIPQGTLSPVLGRLGRDVDLYNGDCMELIASLGNDLENLTLIHADPPWEYENFSNSKQGAASAKYRGGTMQMIGEHLKASYRVAAPHSYLLVWGTFPKLLEFVLATHTLEVPENPRKGRIVRLGDWTYITGGAWGKIDGLGVGFHFRGDAEPALLYRKGKPRSRTHTSNLWLEKRRGHSWKAIKALRALVEAFTGPDGAILDLYAGDSGDLGRICRRLGRGYRGAELDHARYRRALARMSQVELPGFEEPMGKSDKPKARPEPPPQLSFLERDL